MSKPDLIAEILKYNRTASAEYLAQFRDEELRAYLERINGSLNVSRERRVAAVTARAA